MKLENMSEFSLIFLVGILSPCDAFEASKFFYLFNNLLRSMIKVNTGPFFVFIFIAKILGSLRYFNIASKAGSLTSRLLSHLVFWRDI